METNDLVRHPVGIDFVDAHILRHHDGVTVALAVLLVVQGDDEFVVFSIPNPSRGAGSSVGGNVLASLRVDVGLGVEFTAQAAVFLVEGDTPAVRGGIQAHEFGALLELNRLCVRRRLELRDEKDGDRNEFGEEVHDEKRLKSLRKIVKCERVCVCGRNEGIDA